jgi:hypothetical protein
MQVVIMEIKISKEGGFTAISLKLKIMERQANRWPQF